MFKAMRTKIILFAAIAAVALMAVLMMRHTAGIDYADREYSWYTSDENLLVRGSKIEKLAGDVPRLVCAFNRSAKDPERFRTPAGTEPLQPPKLKLKGSTADTITVEVVNDEYLTQRMGTAGADEFLATATFTLTEGGSDRQVNFVFDEGDHAVPGRYARTDFLKRWKVK